MKSFPLMAARVSVALLLLGCIRNQTYFVSYPKSIQVGDTATVKLLHRAMIIVPVDPTTKKSLDSIVFTKLEVWMGSMAGTALYKNSAKAFGYRMPQFDASVLSKSDLDSNAQILRLPKINRFMSTVDTSLKLPDSMVVRSPSGVMKTLNKRAGDAGIVWNGLASDVLGWYYNVAAGKFLVDTLVIPKGTLADSVLDANHGLFAIGIEVDMILQAGLGQTGPSDDTVFYYGRVHAAINNVEDSVIEATPDQAFGAWQVLPLSKPVAIGKRAIANNVFIAHAAASRGLLRNESNDAQAQIFDPRGRLIGGDSKKNRRNNSAIFWTGK